VLEQVHVDAVTLEANALQFEACPLLLCGCPAQFYLAACAQYAVPGELIGRVGAEKPGDRTMIAGVTSGGGNAAIGGDLASGDGEDHATKGEITFAVCECGIAKQLSFGLLNGKLIHDEAFCRRPSL